MTGINVATSVIPPPSPSANKVVIHSGECNSESIQRAPSTKTLENKISKKLILLSLHFHIF